MAVPVKLKDLVEELTLQFDEGALYLNRQTGEVVYIRPEELCAAEENEPLEDFPEWQHANIRIAKDLLDTDHYLPLPTKFDIHEYHVMERFCASVEDADIRDDLCDAIRGRGAFRRFKDSIQAYGIAEAWYRYRDSPARDSGCVV